MNERFILISAGQNRVYMHKLWLASYTHNNMKNDLGPRRLRGIASSYTYRMSMPTVKAEEE